MWPRTKVLIEHLCSSGEASKKPRVVRCRSWFPGSWHLGMGRIPGSSEKSHREACSWEQGKGQLLFQKSEDGNMELTLGKAVTGSPRSHGYWSLETLSRGVGCWGGNVGTEQELGLLDKSGWNKSDDVWQNHGWIHVCLHSNWGEKATVIYG